MAKTPPKCKGCGMTLKWPPWTGKPSRPVELSGKQHNCPSYGGRDFSKREKWIKLTKEMFEQCELCGNWGLTEDAHKTHPQLNYVSRKDHLKTYHPNEEILDDVDFMVISEKEREKRREKYGITKRTKKY